MCGSASDRIWAWSCGLKVMGQSLNRRLLSGRRARAKEAGPAPLASLGNKPRDGGAKLRYPRAGMRGRREHLRKGRGALGQGALDLGNLRRKLCRLHLVRLGQNDLVADRRVAESPQDFVIRGFQPMAG